MTSRASQGSTTMPRVALAAPASSGPISSNADASPSRDRRRERGIAPMSAPQRPRSDLDVARAAWGLVLARLRKAPSAASSKLVAAIREDLDREFPEKETR